MTIYTSRAKCMLMENSPDPDFEAVFYDGNLKTLTLFTKFDSLVM